MTREEISTFPPKEVHIVTFIGQFSTFFGKIALPFWSCQLVFGKSDQWNGERKMAIEYSDFGDS